jgi:hypothetical protein
VGVMILSATFNNISVISLRLVFNANFSSCSANSRLNVFDSLYNTH